MSRKRRRIKSKRPYELCIRAKASLPFVARSIIRFIIGAAVARTQRDNKVDLCHDIWNGSHCHLLIMTFDAQKCVKFYGELQKKITDMLKRLLGLEHLEIWEGEVTVAEILDLPCAIDRISYFYANPAQDNLVATIEDFPGFSGWWDFKRAFEKLDSEQVELFPWIRLPSLPALSNASPNNHDEIKLIRFLRAENKERYKFIRRPNAWMRRFGIETDDETREVNKLILDRIKEREATAKEHRGTKPVLGVHILKTQPIMKEHRPKKTGRKIFVLSSIKRLRIEYIAEFKDFCNLCKDCYKRWRMGDFLIDWPLGAFKPPIPPNVNILSA